MTRAKQAFTLIERPAHGPPLAVLADVVRRRTWRASGLWQKLILPLTLCVGGKSRPGFAEQGG